VLAKNTLVRCLQAVCINMQGIACSEDRRKGQQRVEHRVGWPRTARHRRNTALLPMLNRLRMYRVVVWWYSQSSGVNSVEMDRPLDTSSCPAPRPAKRSAQLRPTIQVTLARPCVSGILALKSW